VQVVLVVESSWGGWALESNGNALGSIHDGCIEGPVVRSSISVTGQRGILCRLGRWCTKYGLNVSFSPSVVEGPDLRSRLEYHLGSRIVSIKSTLFTVADYLGNTVGTHRFRLVEARLAGQKESFLTVLFPGSDGCAKEARR
jgi:hypothetical protein